MPLIRESFGLHGPSKMLDPRVNAIRGDLAEFSLAGKHFSPHYAMPVALACAPAFATIYDKPDGAPSSELLAGEHFALIDVSGGWAWGYCSHDHYVGYLPRDLLIEPIAPPSTSTTGDPIAIARSFLDMPYVWGGRGGAGIDCSGLVQRALAGRGIAAPRDSDMQKAALGELLEETQSLQPGDLIFFPGHVGMMIDGDQLIHATRHHSKTVIEPLATVVARVQQKNDGIGITARKRVG
jgi:cell wall-associated NlpC family hydrolase